MCNLSQELQDKFDETVKNFMARNEMFTGYDLTIETREREELKLRHQDVRNELHSLTSILDALEWGFEGPHGTVNWRKSQIDMPNGGWAFVYHPTTSDPKNYRPRVKTGVKPANVPYGASQIAVVASAPSAPPAASISVVGPVNDSGGQTQDGKFETDYRHRLLVPTRFLKEAGFQPGDMAFVACDAANNTIVIAKTFDSTLTNMQFVTQTIERNGDLRLSSKTLRQAALTDSTFVIETNETVINNEKTKVVEIR